MKKLLISLLFTPLFSLAQFNSGIHCGYDFTTYLVVDVKNETTKESIKGLKISVVNQDLKEVINIANVHSYINANLPLVFTENYKIDDKRWYFPYAEQTYLLSLANTFNAEDFKLKIEDIDGENNNGFYPTQIVDLYNFNMYVLCSSENDKAVQFGKKVQNAPIEVYLNREK